MSKPLSVLLGLVAISGALAGCSSTPSDNAHDGVVRIVASTNVYGDLAKSVAAPDVEITSLIDRADEDPHEFNATGRDQLALSRADVVIVNGGGYDDFAETMLKASGNTTASIVDAVKLSGYDATQPGFNEHVFYDYPTMITVVKAIDAALDIADPAHTSGNDSRAKALEAQLGVLETLESTTAALTRGAGVIITEPVPLYALTASGLDNLTPPKFSEAIENGSDASPALLNQVTGLIANGSARVLVYNAQTGGPQTEALIDAAHDARIPVLGVTETLPEKRHYFEWQQGFLTDLLTALTK